MRQISVIVFFLLALAGNTIAANKDKLYTVDNRIYTGYIATQGPGKQVLFISDNQVIPFDTSELLMIRYEEYNPELETGLNDIIKTRQGDIYSGQIIEQVFGKSIKIKTSEGEITIEAGNILEQRKTKMSSTYSLIEQAPYKTLVKTHQNEEFTGVIIFQYYGNEEKPSYLEVYSEDGVSKRINISDISQMRRVPNNEYREVKVFSVKDGKLYFNQSEASPTPLSKQKKGKTIIYYIDENNSAHHATVDGGAGQRLTVEMKESSEFMKYKLMKIGLQKIGKKELYAFEEASAYKDNVDPYTSTIESNNVMKKVYNVEKGMYLFYKQGSDNAFFIEIK